MRVSLIFAGLMLLASGAFATRMSQALFLTVRPVAYTRPGPAFINKRPGPSEVATREAGAAPEEDAVHRTEMRRVQQAPPVAAHPRSRPNLGGPDPCLGRSASCLRRVAWAGEDGKGRPTFPAIARKWKGGPKGRGMKPPLAVLSAHLHGYRSNAEKADASVPALPPNHDHGGGNR